MTARDVAKISIRRYRGALDCDVVVTQRGQEMVLRCPNHHQAVKWARIECKSYKVPFASLDEGHAYLPTGERHPGEVAAGHGFRNFSSLTPSFVAHSTH